MDDRPNEKAMAALLRLLQAQAPEAQAAVYAVIGGELRLWSMTPGVPLTTGADPAAWRPVDPAIAAALARGGCVVVDPVAVGLDARFAALHPLPGADGAPIGFMLLCDPTRRRRLGPTLAQALTDAALAAAPLLSSAGPRAPPGSALPPAPTGRLAPPAAVLSRVAATLMIEEARAQRNAGWSLYLIDLDRFHAVNEALGDGAGDALLAVLGARFGTCLGLGDRMARLGGDRFVVLAARRPQAAASYAAGLLVAARSPSILAGRSVVIQASIGVVAPVDEQTPTAEILKRAEAALRQAKVEGGNRYVLHDPGTDAATRDVSQLELDLAEALAGGQMHLVYQGYVDLVSGATSGVEALLRWRHPTRGDLAPMAFIPLAEATGLILPLGAWALRTALDAARRWPETIAISVNVSVLQFHEPDFVAQVAAALAASGVNPQRLELEITETVLMRDNPETTAQLEALIAMGVRIALDDFGTGYSALAYLGRLPHHRIKLDRSFVHDLGNPATVELVGAIIALAKKTGVSVTAEGVERPDQLAMVRKLGFTHAQGFITGRPVADPSAQFAARQSSLADALDAMSRPGWVTNIG